MKATIRSSSKGGLLHLSVLYFKALLAGSRNHCQRLKGFSDEAVSLCSNVLRGGVHLMHSMMGKGS